MLQYNQYQDGEPAAPPLVSQHSNHHNTIVSLQLLATEPNVTRPRFQLVESPNLHMLPGYPMVETSSEEDSDDIFDDSDDDDDEVESLVSSLSLDDSLLRFARWSPAAVAVTPSSQQLLAMTKMANLDFPPSAPVEHSRPPMEIIIVLKLKEKKSPIITTRPDWLRDGIESVVSVPSSMSYSSTSTDLWLEKPFEEVSPTSSSHRHVTLHSTSNMNSAVGNTVAPMGNDQEIFRPPAQIPNTRSSTSRPDLARRAVTFPETTTTQFASRPMCQSPLPSVPLGNQYSQPPSASPSPATLSPRNLFRRSKSFPNDGVLVAREDFVGSDLHQPLNMTGNKNLLAQPQARSLHCKKTDKDRHQYGGAAGVGSVAGQISFYTAPTTSSSTGGPGGAGGGANDDPIMKEGFHQYLRVQGMLNALVFGEPTTTKTTNRTIPGQNRRPSWNLIRRLSSRKTKQQQQRPSTILSPKHVSGAHVDAHHCLDLKQPVGFFS